MHFLELCPIKDKFCIGKRVGRNCIKWSSGLMFITNIIFTQLLLLACNECGITVTTTGYLKYRMNSVHWYTDIHYQHCIHPTPFPIIPQPFSHYHSCYGYTNILHCQLLHWLGCFGVSGCIFAAHMLCQH